MKYDFDFGFRKEKIRFLEVKNRNLGSKKKKNPILTSLFEFLEYRAVKIRFLGVKSRNLRRRNPILTLGSEKKKLGFLE